MDRQRKKLTWGQYLNRYKGVSKPVTNCRGQEFPSIGSAARYFKITHSNIYSCLRSQSKNKSANRSAGKYSDGTKVKWRENLSSNGSPDLLITARDSLTMSLRNE